jgi:hypothetical protein
MPACCVMPPLKTLPPHPGDPSGGVIYLRIVVSRGSISHMCSVTKVFFNGEELLAPRPTPKLEDHPVSTVRDCLFNIFAATLLIGARSSVRTLRTRHAVVTGTPFSHGKSTTKLIIIKCYLVI